MNTQIDSNAMNNSSVTDMDDVIPQLLMKGNNQTPVRIWTVRRSSCSCLLS